MKRELQHLTPKEAYAFLQEHPEALFIDCRSEIEYWFVGHPVGAVHVAWVEAPNWARNPHFEDQVRKLAGDGLHRPVVVICRSGNRSVTAGEALLAAGFTHVINVVHGFEGDLDEHHHRSSVNGWRFDGLPWEQG
jgi:rhodanese-related sulfurtransferase